MTQTVVVADDHQLIREALVTRLRVHPSLKVVAEATDGLEAIALTRRHQPDLLTLDIAMPYAQGISVFAEIRRWSPGTRVAIFSGITSARLLADLQAAGVDGIFTKRGDISEFVTAVPTILKGGKVISSDAAAIIEGGAGADALTIREQQVVSQIASGLTTRQIAEVLGVSPKTVENHRSNIMRKLDVDSMAKLLAYAIREGLFDPQTQL